MFEMRKTPQGEQLTAGYPAVEDLIETEQFDAVNKAFGDAYTQLDEIIKKKKGLKAVAEAKVAQKAIDTVMELFKGLLAVKYELQRQQGQKK